MAVVLDTGAVSRGSGNQGSHRERNIRKAFVEADLIEAVILLPENLFYNTTAPRGHPGGQPGQAEAGQDSPHQRQQASFAKGRPKNYLAQEHTEQIADVYHAWRAEEGLSAIITKEEASRNDYNLLPSRYVATGEKEDVLPPRKLRCSSERQRRSVLRSTKNLRGCYTYSAWGTFVPIIELQVDRNIKFMLGTKGV